MSSAKYTVEFCYSKRMYAHSDSPSENKTQDFSSHEIRLLHPFFSLRPRDFRAKPHIHHHHPHLPLLADCVLTFRFSLLNHHLFGTKSWFVSSLASGNQFTGQVALAPRVFIYSLGPSFRSRIKFRPRILSVCSFRPTTTNFHLDKHIFNLSHHPTFWNQALSITSSGTLRFFKGLVSLPFTVQLSTSPCQRQPSSDSSCAACACKSSDKAVIQRSVVLSPAQPSNYKKPHSILRSRKHQPYQRTFSTNITTIHPFTKTFASKTWVAKCGLRRRSASTGVPSSLNLRSALVAAVCLQRAGRIWRW